MKRFVPGWFMLSLFLFAGAATLEAGGFQSQFSKPPMKFRPQPFYFWNDSVKAEVVARQMKEFRDKDGYGGFCIFGYGPKFKPEYLSDSYFNLYGKTLATAKKLKLSLSLYDEYGFPSGGGGAKNADGVPRFKNANPDLTLKRLDRFEETVTGPKVVYRPIPEGRIMAVVAMDSLHRRFDLTTLVYANRLKWHVPKGAFRVQYFYLVPDVDPLVDYLDPDAVKAYVRMTHQAYFERFHASFGKTFTSTFFDEPTLYRAKGRVWTGAFNDKFREKYQFNPATLYPALWEDIGPETQAARNLLFGFRAELYAQGYPKVTSEWSVARGLQATGHQDQEEVENPVGVSGDLMKAFQYQDAPGIDQIGGNRPAFRFIKLISGAANNWDKHVVVSETYGAMGNLPIDSMYRIAMDQYAKGVNRLVPHAVWYNDKDVKYLPELSYRNPLYAADLPAFNQYLSRLNVVLQAPARHVADVAVLYPIHTLQGEHHMDGPLKSTFGGMVIPRTNYVQVSNRLTDQIGIDYTFLHPEVLDSRCTVEDSLLVLQNTVNKEAFRVLVLPSVKTISVSNLKQVVTFYSNGGRVIFVGRLPWKSAELGKDAEIHSLVTGLFPQIASTAVGDSFPDVRMEASNDKGGRALLVLEPSDLDPLVPACVETPDVVFEPGKTLEYLHKIRDGKHLFFLANINPGPYVGTIALRGDYRLQTMDPHTGKTVSCPVRSDMRGGRKYTLVDLRLSGTRSVFLVEK